MDSLLIRGVRVVPLDGTAPDPSGTPVDVLVEDGTVTEVAPTLPRPPGGEQLEGGGRWVLPGLWDHHVHVRQWGLVRSRLDLSGARDADEAVDLVRRRLAEGNLPTSGVLTGWGHRPATWGRDPSTADLDAVAPDVPVVLISGDGHHGWLNSRAMDLLGAPRRDGVIAEAEWFAVYERLGGLPGAHDEAEAGVALALADAVALGVVGITDLEFGRPWAHWRDRVAEHLPALRARVGVYPEGLEEVLAAGVRTGDTIRATDGLVTMGPLKIISDGSLNTRTAWCCQPYADGASLAEPAGAPNLGGEELVDLLATARRAGLEVALHAIGDAAVHQALTAFGRTGARGGIEHAQLVAVEDLDRWRRLPVRASVQPAHLLDDRVVTEQCWPDRTDRTFTLRSFLDRGIEVVLGSDAPVSPLDPWLAAAAAVHRGPLDGENWHPEQALTPVEALAASVDGRRVRAGAPGDLVLLEDDPLGAPGATSAEQARRLRATRVSATVVAGTLIHGG
ncbi:amidohydrolase [Ornithinimicrobium kibberense]|jgi:predicted amidohydrolase YtcJ|uniref:Amidohydrolase n=1 Tax=Ornithinimicrobium kibberense TaxID=282060 RepID=A0ABV5V407_9MICO|nr:amidohydrolase family protein [Ornithinimicrobium kibberense]